MELRKRLYTPAWRDPKTLRAQRRSERMRPLMGLLTVACMLCLAFPSKFNYARAISMQLADGELAARILFGLLFLTLGYFAVRLWVWGSRAASVSSGLMLVALGVIASTHPLSKIHNNAFVLLSLGLCVGHVGLFFKDADPRLFFTAAGALGGLLLCPFNLGVGERVLIASSCLTVLLLYYDELDP